MAIQTRSDLKNTFVTGAKPVQQDFADLFDSYWHMNDNVATGDWVSSNFAPATGSENYVQIDPPVAQPGGFKLATGVLGQQNTVSAKTILSLRSDLPDTHGLIAEVQAPGNTVFAGFFKNVTGTTVGVASGNAALNLSGGILKLANSLSDYPALKGGLYFNSLTGKMRLWDTAWSNVATETWVQANAIQANPADVQPASFNVSGDCRLGGLLVDGGNAVNPDLLSFGTSGFIYIKRNPSDTNLQYSAFNHVFYGNVATDSALSGTTLSTSAPSPSGAGTWKLGKPVAGPVTADATKYVEVMIDGQLVKLMVAQ